MYLIVLPDEMTLVGKFSDLNQAILAAELDYADVATDIFPNEGKNWSRYGRLALLMLLRNHHVEGGDILQYGDMIKSAQALADSMPMDQRSLRALEAKAGPRPLLGDIRPIERLPYNQPVSEPCKGAPPSIKAKAPSAPGASRAAPTKGATARVWEIADKHMADMLPEGTSMTLAMLLSNKEFRKQVIELCEAEGLNPGTAATQFGKWKGSKGL